MAALRATRHRAPAGRAGSSSEIPPGRRARRGVPFQIAGHPSAAAELVAADIRRHAERAIRMDWPTVLVLNRPGADARRNRLLEAWDTKRGCDRDEYPLPRGHPAIDARSGAITPQRTGREVAVACLPREFDRTVRSNSR
jgi:hypothetical protein